MNENRGVPSELAQLQTDLQEAEGFVTAAEQLKQEGYTAEAIDCLTNAIDLHRRLIPQLIEWASAGPFAYLVTETTQTPMERLRQFEQHRQEAAKCLNLGKQLEQNGKPEEAEEAYRRAIQLNPNLPWSYHSLGDLLAQKNQLDEAIHFYCECIRLSPETPWSYHAAGDILARKGQLEEAAAFYRYAIHFKPDLCWTHNALGDIYTLLGDLHQAAEYYRKAIEVEPTLEHARARLASICPEGGDNS